MISTENIQRQVAVMVVVAVKEATFLVAVNDIIGGVYVQYNLFRSLVI